MPDSDRVLVAVLKERRDLIITREQHWYRIPVEQIPRRLRRQWPPHWLAFYQPRKFGKDGCVVRYYARVQDIREATRHELLPGEPNPDKQYYQLLLEPLQELPRPIVSRRRRVIIFISTTWEKLMKAEEINDLYTGSNLEERLWIELRKRQIQAERQQFVKINGRRYALDFAVYCKAGKLDIETDGVTWHTRPEVIVEDKARDSALQTDGWKPLRFSAQQVYEQLQEYCVPKIIETIAELGGLEGI